MERLTKRYIDEDDGRKSIGAYTGYTIPEIWFEGEREYRVLDKLATYEDLEEQGLLVRLPCKVGDDVYIIPSPPICGLNIFYGCENVNRVYHQHIESITFAGSHWYATGRNEYKEKVLNDTAFGMTWFLTREEAEKELEEMKNE